MYFSTKLNFTATGGSNIVHQGKNDVDLDCSDINNAVFLKRN